MHEVSIMTGILEICLEEAAKHKALQISKIRLEIGEKAGVVIDSLEFAFDVVTKNTIAENAVLEIDSIPFQGECIECGKQFKATDGFLECPHCHNVGKIISGQELNIINIEVND